MKSIISKQVKPAFMLMVIFSILTGGIYPVLVTGIAQVIFPWQANGSMLERNGKIVASQLIGQSMTDPRYFMSRPSATTPFPYNALSSSGSNSGPTNPEFIALLKRRVTSLHTINPENFYLVPVDLVTASASGLDPDISIWAAIYQAKRIAKLRSINEKAVVCQIINKIKPRYLGILGEPRVNVVELNMGLDTIVMQKPPVLHKGTHK